MTDREMAQWMIGTREHGYTVRRAYHSNLASWVYFIITLAAIVFVTVAAQAWAVACFVIGFTFGMLIRDYTWVHTSRKTWPYFVKVVNWERVEQLASDSPN